MFLAAFFALAGAPAFYSLPDNGPLKAAMGSFASSILPPFVLINIAVIGGAIPMFIVGVTTAPFVTYVHVRLPVAARRSREALLQWSKHMPVETEVDLTTMRLIGVPRVRRMKLSDLRTKTDRRFFDIANLVQVQKPSPHSQTPRTVRKVSGGPRFFVTQEGRGRVPFIWQSAMKKIAPA